LAGAAAAGALVGAAAAGAGCVGFASTFGASVGFAAGACGAHAASSPTPPMPTVPNCKNARRDSPYFLDMPATPSIGHGAGHPIGKVERRENWLVLPARQATPIRHEVMPAVGV
jgi:hypothetical protein